MAFKGHLARIPPGFLFQRLSQDPGDLLESLVLQEAGEQQVPRFQEGNVLGVLHFTGGQEARRLQVQQRCGNHQELAGFIQRPVLPQFLETPDVFDEFISDRGQGHLSDIKLVLGNEAEQKVKGSREVSQPYLEAGLAGFGGTGVGRFGLYGRFGVYRRFRLRRRSQARFRGRGD